jgi:hypothetical protein
MLNESEINDVLEYLAYRDGANIGKRITSDLAAGRLKIPPNGILELEISEFSKFESPMVDKILSTVGSSSGMALGNTGLAVGGGAILLMSGKNYFEAKNKAAKVCYILSIICSGTGTVSSTISVYCNRCGLSKTGMLGDGFGGLFLKAGDYMNKIGETVEGKRPGLNRFSPKSWITRRPVSKMGAGYKGLSFVPPGCYPTISVQELISNISYENFFLVGGTVLAIYSYGKCIISVYNYLDSKFSSKENYSEQIQFSARFLVDSLFNNPVYRIYFAALNCPN